MNIQKLRFFIDVVDCGSFTGAAKKNFISQTAISQHIASIENEVGFKVFERVKGRVNLTSAGVSFCHDCRILLQYYDRAVIEARNISDVQKEKLYIGITGPTEGFFLPEVIKQFRKVYTNVEIVIEMGSFIDLKNKLDFGDIDVTFNFIYDLMDEKKFEIINLFEVPVELLVSRNHRFAIFDEINAIDVANETIIMLNKNYGPANFEHMINARRSEGYEPNLKLVDSIDLLLFYVEVNQGVAFIPSKFMNYDHDLCKIVHIRNCHDATGYILAYNKTKFKPILPEFIRIVKNTIKRL